MAYNYTIQTNDQQAKAAGTELPLSTKQGIEICNHIRGKSLTRAKAILDDAIALHRAIPFKRFTNGLGHKPGRMTSGRYHPKACKIIKDLLISAESNALNKGLSIPDLVVKHICVHKAGNQFHMGSRRGIRMKRSHLEVVLEANPDLAKKQSKTTAKPAKKAVKATPKKEEQKPVAEAKPVEKKVEKTETPATEKKAEPKQEQPKPAEKAAEVKPLPEKKTEEQQ